MAQLDDVLPAGVEHALTLKAGIHTGECELVAGRRSGVPFRMAAALADASSERQVVVSRTVKDLVSGSHVQFERRGSQRVPGVAGAWETYVVTVSVKPGEGHPASR